MTCHKNCPVEHGLFLNASPCLSGYLLALTLILEPVSCLSRFLPAFTLKDLLMRDKNEEPSVDKSGFSKENDEVMSEGNACLLQDV